jgi:hypothetical protein
LLQLIYTLGPTGRFAGGLYRWQQQRHQNADDGDDNQEFHQREPLLASLIRAWFPVHHLVWWRWSLSIVEAEQT